MATKLPRRRNRRLLVAHTRQNRKPSRPTAQSGRRPRAYASARPCAYHRLPRSRRRSLHREAGPYIHALGTAPIIGVVMKRDRLCTTAATEEEARLMDTATQPTRSGARLDAPYRTEARPLGTLGAREAAHPAMLQGTGLQKRQGYWMARFSAQNRALAISSYPGNMERVVKRWRTPARTRGAPRRRAPLSLRAGKVADLSRRG